MVFQTKLNLYPFFFLLFLIVFLSFFFSTSSSLFSFFSSTSSVLSFPFFYLRKGLIVYPGWLWTRENLSLSVRVPRLVLCQYAKIILYSSNSCIVFHYSNEITNVSIQCGWCYSVEWCLKLHIRRSQQSISIHCLLLHDLRMQCDQLPQPFASISLRWWHGFHQTRIHPYTVFVRYVIPMRKITNIVSWSSILLLQII